MAKKQSLEKLSTIINAHASDNRGMAFRNLFATACYLFVEGKKQAATKLLYSLFDQLGWGRREGYFQAISKSMDKFAAEYAAEIDANSELNQLF